MTGIGTYIYNNGNTYTGGWVSGKRQGEGECYYANGAHYKGDFKGDLRDGFGIYTSPNKDIYQGEFKNDERWGKGRGTISSPEGGVYDGGALLTTYIIFITFVIALSNRVTEWEYDGKRNIQMARW
jgi:hypothetical protein